MEIRNGRPLAVRNDSDTFPYFPNPPVDNDVFRVLVQLELNVLHVHAEHGDPLRGQLFYVVEDDAVVLQRAHNRLTQEQVV